MRTFIGVDLGWYRKPSGLASITQTHGGSCLQGITRLEQSDEILNWIESQVGNADSVVAVDAPLVIPNRRGIRPAERELNSDSPLVRYGGYTGLGRFAVSDLQIRE